MELYFLKSLKVNCTDTACSSFMRPSFGNTGSSGNSVEKYYFLVLNVNLQVKIRFKTFY